jgi:hypothetical protein
MSFKAEHQKSSMKWGEIAMKEHTYKKFEEFKSSPCIAVLCLVKGGNRPVTIRFDL